MVNDVGDGLCRKARQPRDVGSRQRAVHSYRFEHHPTIEALSAVEVPYMEMGQAAAERLLEYIRGERDLSDTSKIYLQPRLAVRESTGTPEKSAIRKT